MATPGPVTTDYLAYDRLKTQLEQSYKSYKKLHKDGELSQLVKKHVSKSSETKPEEMYVPNPLYTDEMKPAHHTSDYLRGGVISTMATFEAFVGSLINEATDLVARHYDHEKRCQNDPCDLKEINPDMCKRYSNRQKPLTPKDVTLHNWDTSNLTKCTCTCAECAKTHRKVYARYLLNKSEIDRRKSLVDVILQQGEFRFSYVITGNDISQITIATGQQSKCLICIMLRFCYGVRCVMAHGDSTQTYSDGGGALFNFCKRCKACGCVETCITCEIFKDIARLVELFNKYIDQLPDTERDEAESIVRRNPNRSQFQNFRKGENGNRLTRQQWDECEEIIVKYFQKPVNNPLPVAHAYFHMLRMYYWLEKSGRKMYITYGMFESITNFIHTLSFRMYLAVAELLINNYGLPDGVWRVEKHMIGTTIRLFQNQSVATTYMLFKYALYRSTTMQFACL